MADAPTAHAPCTARAARRESASHWSRPGAVRTLRALLRLGFAATTWQIAEQTGSLAVHSDITSVRCFCEAEGICVADKAVSCTYTGTTDAGHRVYRYELHPLVIAAIKRGLLNEEEPDLEGRAPARPRTRRAEATHQGVLFNAALPPYLRPH